MSDEIVSVQVTAAPLTPVAGKGNVRYKGQVEIRIADIVLPIDGWTVRSDARGRLAVFEPTYRDPTTGQWKSVVDGWPVELVRACAETLLGQIEGGRLYRAPMPDEA